MKWCEDERCVVAYSDQATKGCLIRHARLMTFWVGAEIAKRFTFCPDCGRDLRLIWAEYDVTQEVRLAVKRQEEANRQVP